MVDKIFFTLILIISFAAKAKNIEPKVIYGDDDRVDSYLLPTYSKLARATAGRIPKRLLSEKNNTFNPLSIMRLQDPNIQNLCPDELFAAQPILADCTGFLYSEDVLITAGHCAIKLNTTVIHEKNDACKNNYWAFDFKLEGGSQDQSLGLDAQNIYECQEVVYATYQKTSFDDNGRPIPGLDFAIIKLNKKVKDREPLSFRKGPAKLFEKIFMIGHPSGLPLKVTTNAEIQDNIFSDFFVTNLDSFHGNSGSPVFGEDNKVIGILVRGKPDYYFDHDENGRKCMRTNKCDPNRENCINEQFDIDGEHVTRISKLYTHLKNL